MLGQATGDLDSPRPELGGSHHLPPYSILCVSLPHLHPNGTFSWDSQSGVPKLSRFRLPKLWAFITSRPDFGLGRGLKQSCSSPQELSNNVSHFTCTHRDQVDSWLLVVGSQIGSLTPSPCFNHNLCCRCPNGSCEAILDIYTSRTFQQYKEHPDARCFDPCNQTLKFWESQRTPKSHFRECEPPPTSLKVGLRHLITQLFLVSDQWVFFRLFFFLNPDLHTTFSPRIQYKRRGEKGKKNRRKDSDKLQVVGSRVRLITIKWHNWHSKDISLHN